MKIRVGATLGHTYRPKGLAIEQPLFADADVRVDLARAADRAEDEDQQVRIVAMADRAEPQPLTHLFDAIRDQDVSVLPRPFIGHDQPRIQDFPQAFQDFVEPEKLRLLATCRRVAGLLRWRLGEFGRDHPFRGISEHWSRDGTAWYPLPPSIELSARMETSQPWSSEAVADVARMANLGWEEPTHFVLLREAWNVGAHNARASLVLAVAAAEVGVKNTIARLAPDAEWLATKIPAPRLARVIKEYLPTLAAHPSIGGHVRIPEPDVLSVIFRAVDERNQALHASADRPDRQDVDSLIGAVRRLLFALDYSCGEKWARWNIPPNLW